MITSNSKMNECAGKDDPETFRNPTNCEDKEEYEPLLFQSPESDLEISRSLSLREATDIS